MARHHASFRRGSRSVSLVTAGHTETLHYPGMIIAKYIDGTLVAEKWLPQSEDPTERDDESLIEALRDAMLWSDHATR
ncbi:hypothetical protein SAMN05421504_111132 [Amycolatopsis xylanica]|uniref:Uncharacterized protein n=1 Tax=Amycolatopsis xylanica TaxID=589385 RepID=A0A1H3RKY1_9PSEU|nr:hypothetical protein SAMN05421504_111132 [Amycolatopsis xylanica]